MGGGALRAANHGDKGAAGGGNGGLTFRTEKGKEEHEREWESESRRPQFGSPPHCAFRSREESAMRRPSSGGPPTPDGVLKNFDDPTKTLISPLSISQTI